MHPPTRLRTASRFLLGLAFIGVGVLHFVRPEFFVRIMPAYLPWHLELVWLSGAFEILGGVGVLVERTRRFAGFGLLALLVAVFPANINMALHASDFADISPPIGLWLRLPGQLVLLALVWWAAGLSEKTGVASARVDTGRSGR